MHFNFYKSLLVGLSGLFILSCSRETPTVEFTLGDQTVQEYQGTAVVTAELSVPASIAVRVPYTLSGTATGGGSPADDYLGSNGTLIIPVGEKSASLNFPLVEHGAVIPDRSLIVTLGTPENAELGTADTQTVTISNSGAPPSSVTGSFPGAITPDECGTWDGAVIPFTLDLPAPTNLTFGVAINAVGLTDGTHYQVTTSTIPPDGFMNPYPTVLGTSINDFTISSGGSGTFLIIAVSSCGVGPVSGATIQLTVTPPLGHSVNIGTTEVTFP